MPREAGARFALLHYFRALWRTCEKNIAGAVPHATIPTLRFEGPRYYGSDRLLSPSSCQLVPRRDIMVRNDPFNRHHLPVPRHNITLRDDNGEILDILH